MSVELPLCVPRMLCHVFWSQVEYKIILFITVGDTFSTVEVVQYSGDKISTVGVPSVLWGITSVLWRLLSTVETRLGVLRIFKESLNLFQKLISLRNQIDHIAGLKC